jgi:hypothetical protein
MGLAPSLVGFAPFSTLFIGPSLLSVKPGQKLNIFHPSDPYSYTWHAVTMCSAALETRYGI